MTGTSGAFLKGGPQNLVSSPPNGVSTFHTSAPISARICVQNGPANIRLRSNTFTPDNAPPRGRSDEAGGEEVKSETAAATAAALLSEVELEETYLFARGVALRAGTERTQFVARTVASTDFPLAVHRRWILFSCRTHRRMVAAAK